MSMSVAAQLYAMTLSYFAQGAAVDLSAFGDILFLFLGLGGVALAIALSIVVLIVILDIIGVDVLGLAKTLKGG